MSIKTFRIISNLEVLSFLILLLIAMPLKYIFDLPLYVKYVGWAHGVLFVLYLAGALAMYRKLNWSFKTLFIAGLSSIIPLGPLYIERKYLPKKD
ncbi:MAG TPA: DUF3817 domain-containing protein [Brumimicrobium sp.]|nr:DUF3817 domain-containing protein [Brumimicrobium sp.]